MRRRGVTVESGSRGSKLQSSIRSTAITCTGSAMAMASGGAMGILSPEGCHLTVLDRRVWVAGAPPETGRRAGLRRVQLPAVGASRAGGLGSSATRIPLTSARPAPCCPLCASLSLPLPSVALRHPALPRIKCGYHDDHRSGQDTASAALPRPCHLLAAILRRRPCIHRRPAARVSPVRRGS